MRPLLLASILLVPAAARADVRAASPAVSADSDERALQLLRAIRLKAASGAGDETALRDEAKELGAVADAHGRELAALAGGYLDLLDSGKPLPPPTAEELADDADDDGDVDAAGRAAVRAQAAADSRAAAEKTAALLDQVSGAATNPTTAGPASFDGTARRASLPVEVEPAPGYHTVNADDFLSQPDDASRVDAMIAATTELLAKAARKNVGNEHAIYLGKLLAKRIAADPEFSSMLALRVRARPDGQLVIVYRLLNGAVVEKPLGLSLDDGSSAARIYGTKKRRRRRAAAASSDGGDAGDGGESGGKHSHAKAPGAPDFGDGGGDAGAIGAGGAGGGRAGGELGESGGSELAAGDDGAAGGADEGARSGGVIDPDGAPAAGRAKRGSNGASGAPAPSVSVPGGFTTASGPGDDAPAGGAGGGADAAPGPGTRRAKGSAGAEEIPALPRLSGDLSGGRGLAAGGAPPSAAPTVADARASVAARTASAPAPAPSFASGTPAGPAYDAASDGPLRDAVAASAVSAPPAVKTSPAPAKDAPARSAAVPAALLFASAALGGAGFFLQRSQS